MASPPAQEPPGSPPARPDAEQPPQQERPPGVRKCGYLRKHKHGHKRFFVLRAAGAGAEEAPRLEYYESEKKWRGKSAAPRRSIALDACLSIHKRADAKHKHLVALYTRHEYFALAAESEQEQDGWYRALTELLREGQAAALGPGPGSPGSPQGASCEDCGYGQAGGGAAAYREVWQVTLKPRGLGQSRGLTGVHRLCLAARTVALVRLNCERPSVTLQLMSIRRCGHSDSFFFLELGRSASTGPGELWMQADDAVVAQNIHETVLEAMRALREPAEFRPRSKSQSSSSSSSGGAASAGGFAAMCSRPISVPGRRHPHHPLVALPPGHTALLRRSRTETLAVASSSSSSRARTTSEGDGCRTGSLAGSPLSPDAGCAPLSRSHTLGATGCRQSGPAATQPGRALALGHWPRSAVEPAALSQHLSSGSISTSGSPSEPAAFMAFEDLGSSPGGDPRPFSSSSTASNHSNTPDTPPGQQQLDGYMAMEQGCLCHRPYLWESTGGDKVPRKRTCSLTTLAHQRPVPLPLSSASLDEYTLMRATFPTAGVSPKAVYAPYPEDYGDVEIGSGGTSSSSSSHLGHSGGREGKGNYVPMSPGVVSARPIQGGHSAYAPMSPTSVSAPQQILQSHPYKINSDCSPDDSSYMRMWGTGTRSSGESPDGRLANGDYISMSSLASTTSASLMTFPDDLSGHGPGDQSSYFYSPPSHTCLSQASSLSEKDSDQYVLMNSPAGRLIHIPKGEPFPATCSHSTMPLPINHNRTESSLSQWAGSAQPSHLSLEPLLSSLDKHCLPHDPQSPSGEYVNIGYSVELGFTNSASPLGCDLSGSHRSPISNYANLTIDGLQSNAISVGSFEEALLLGSCPSPVQPGKHYLKSGVGMACLPSPSSEAGDYTEMAFTTVTSPSQPILHKPENACLASPVAGLKRLTLSGVEAFIFANPPPDPNYGAKVIRADPQGRRRHSSETFSSTTTVTPVSPSFAHNPKRHNSASVENVSLRKNEGLAEEQNSSPMCRETSAGFQNGLNYIAVDLVGGDHLENGDHGKHPLGRNISGTYCNVDFLTHNLKEATSVKVC
ncbi:insulin receptor substrate 2 [Tiliqua scincoides]|uniref:insulin receptor substrate 2 n=1 Tax=Tiliqua scincoides TaxID=71010 RepID=UPI00346363B8